MDRKIFYLIEGNNGATYVFNVSNWKSIEYSVRFYKSRTLKQSVIKYLMRIFLYVMGMTSSIAGWKALKNRNEVINSLVKITGKNADYEVDSNCSVLVSSTKDKVIVHHHGSYFHKYSFGNSYNSALNELHTYKILESRITEFKISRIFDIENDKEILEFKLKNSHLSNNSNTKLDAILVSGLVDLFTLNGTKKINLSEYISGLLNKIPENLYCENEIKNLLTKLTEKYGEYSFSLGLVHRDFKPWNIDEESGVLVYDFEEAVADGPPLEDLLNYYIDPEIRYKTSSDMLNIIFNEDMEVLYNDYLEKINLDLNYMGLLYTYLIERIIFWYVKGEEFTSQKYCELLETIILTKDSK